MRQPRRISAGSRKIDHELGADRVGHENKDDWDGLRSVNGVIRSLRTDADQYIHFHRDEFRRHAPKSIGDLIRKAMYQYYVLPVLVSKIAQPFSEAFEIAPFFLSASCMP